MTWDDPASPGKNFNDHTGNRYDYFLISDARINKNHKATSSGRQTCSSDYDAKAILKHAANSGLHKNVAFVTSKSEVATAIKKAVEANKTELTLWYYDTTVTEATMWSVLDGLLVGAPYPAQIKPSYPPVNGVTKYILALTPLSEWNKMTVATSASQLTALIDSAFDSGKTTLTVRYEPTNGNLTIYGGKYGFRYVPSEYNDGKAVLLVITEPY